MSAKSKKIVYVNSTQYPLLLQHSRGEVCFLQRRNFYINLGGKQVLFIKDPEIANNGIFMAVPELNQELIQISWQGPSRPYPLNPGATTFLLH